MGATWTADAHSPDSRQTSVVAEPRRAPVLGHTAELPPRFLRRQTATESTARKPVALRSKLAGSGVGVMVKSVVAANEAEERPFAACTALVRTELV